MAFPIMSSKPSFPIKIRIIVLPYTPTYIRREHGTLHIEYRYSGDKKHETALSATEKTKLEAVIKLISHNTPRKENKNVGKFSCKEKGRILPYICSMIENLSKLHFILDR